MESWYLYILVKSFFNSSEKKPEQPHEFTHDRE